MYPERSAPTCKACKVNARELPSSGSVHPLLLCPRCGLRSIADPETVNDASVEQSEAEYLRSYSKRLQPIAHRRVAMVRKCVPPPARCLDFGASFGVIADRLILAGYDVSTFEKSPQAVESMRRRRFRVYSDIEQLPHDSFDVITLWHVLEHLPDPAAALSRLLESLVPAGALLLAVPNAEGLFARLGFDHWIWTMPWHLHYFTKRSLEEMLLRNGLAIQSIATDTGDVAALETLVGGLILRAPSRLTRQSGAQRAASREGGVARKATAALLRTLAQPVQRLAMQFGAGEELLVHAIKT